MERKEALEVVRKNMPTDRSLPVYEALQTLIPELAESEDERIRKWLIELVKSTDTNHNNMKLSENCKLALAYLEKQKEQKPAHFELKAGKWYICHRAFCCRADHLTVKEGERFMCEKDGIVKGFVIKEPEKYFKECSAPAPMEDEQNVQKPAEWSEEDADILNCCISSIEEAKENRYAYKETDGNTSYDREIAWLKSLRPSWKPSEQEKGALRTSIHVLTEERSFPKAAAQLQNILNAFEGKESRPSWKPSEEQMEALKCTIADVAKFSKRGGRQVELENEPYYKALHSLYCNLEKLM